MFETAGSGGFCSDFYQGGVASEGKRLILYVKIAGEERGSSRKSVNKKATLTVASL